jgi:hypothetical protein
MNPVSTKLTDAEKLKLLTKFADDVANWLRDGETDEDSDTVFHVEDYQSEILEDVDRLIERARTIRDQISWCDVVTFDLPSYWASALINGDFSGCSVTEEDEINAWMEKNGNPSFCSVDNDRIERGNDATNLLCDTSTFSVLVPKAEPISP